MRSESISAGIARSPGNGGAKIGNVHLKWAFPEAVLWMLGNSEDAKAFLKRKEKKYGKARTMMMLARKIARAVYQMLKRKQSFDAVMFFAAKCHNACRRLRR
jgi:hypothetical protein